jgi:hypothetical protein
MTEVEAPGAHLLAPVRTRGCSWLGCGASTDVAGSASAALHLPGCRQRCEHRSLRLAARIGNARLFCSIRKLALR